MNFKFLKNYLLMISVFLSSINYAQFSISGKIVDQDGEPLIGATVFIKEISVGASSDINGEYQIDNVEKGDYSITYSAVGYKSSEEAITIISNMVRDVNLAEDILLLDEAVVIGYGTARTKDLTGSAAVINSEDFNKGSVTTPEQLVMGKVPGVKINSNNGAPGSGSTIRIRGGTSINASNDPLIVIDGVPLDNGGVAGAANPLNLINPNDIETFVVLKDASATAIYGSRGANGVILITTKKGKGDGINVNFTTNNSLSTIVKYTDVLSADEYRDVINEFGTQNQIDNLRDSSTNWQDQVYRMAYINENNVSVSGGIAGVPFRFSAGNKHEEGLLKRHQLDRYAASLNLSPKFLDDHLQIDINSRFVHTDNFFADQSAIWSSTQFDPTMPIYSGDTAYGGYYETLFAAGGNAGKPIPLAIRNPLGLINQKEDVSDVNRFIGNAKLIYNTHFIPELKAVLNVGTDIVNSNGTVLIPETAASNFQNGGFQTQYDMEKSNQLIEGFFNYSNSEKAVNHRIDITAGYSFQEWSTKSPSYPGLNIAGDTLNAPGIPTDTKNALLSYYTRGIYSFSDKYIVTATMRRDGSSRFSPENRWGWFPSASAAWIISEESFLKNSNLITYLKARAGYGVTGQQDIFYDYPYIPNYQEGSITAQYQFGNQFVSTLRPDGYDYNIKWETTSSSNFGIDFGLLNDKINGSVDYYIKETSDLLATVPVVAGTNFTNFILTNVGSMKNEGIEINLNLGLLNSTTTNIELGLNATYNKNTVTGLSLVPDTSSIGIQVGGIAGGIGNTAQIHTVGYPTFTYFFYEANYDENGKPVENQFVDQNNDSVINIDDRVRSGNPNPNWFLGANLNASYKKWYVGTSMRAELGAFVYNNLASNNGNLQAGNSTFNSSNIHSSFLETNFQGSTNEQLLSNYFLEKANFLRMDYFTLGYNFGNQLSDKFRLNAALTVNNVFVLTQYSGMDPEVVGGIDNNIYPRPRIYSLNLTFDF
jgi:TonB-linked SusC/RagA family outer membrane protein